MALKRWLLAAVTVPSLAKALAVQNQMPLATARADWHGNGGNADVIKLYGQHALERHRRH